MHGSAYRGDCVAVLTGMRKRGIPVKFTGEERA
jgi:hypothetical protein